jgi:hypothetical protein
MGAGQFVEFVRMKALEQIRPLGDIDDLPDFSLEGLLAVGAG